jgi:hypothetical protein
MTRTCSRFRRSSVKTPRATLVPLPPSRCSEKLQKIVRSFSKFGLKATSSSPPCPRAVIGGKPPCPLAADTPPEPTGSNPPIGCPISPFAETMRRFPDFSVIKKSPFGSGSTAQGCPILSPAPSRQKPRRISPRRRESVREKPVFVPARSPFWFRAARKLKRVFLLIRCRIFSARFSRRWARAGASAQFERTGHASGFRFYEYAAQTAQRRKARLHRRRFRFGDADFRHDNFAGYKANRADMPDDLKSQMPYIKKVCEAFGIPILKVDGFEADDLSELWRIKSPKKDAGRHRLERQGFVPARARSADRLYAAEFAERQTQSRRAADRMVRRSVGRKQIRRAAVANH